MEIYSELENYYWLFKAIATFLVTFFLLAVESRVLKVLKERAANTKTILDDALIVSCDGPLKFMIIFCGIFYITRFIIDEFASEYSFGDLSDISQTIVYHILFLWFCIKFIKSCESLLTKLPKSRLKINRTSISAISRISTITITALVVLNIIKPVFGVPISALLAFGGIGGIAVALACQDLLANIFGGMFIYLDRPFDIGDWISSPEKDIQGYVETIGMRLTRIRTFDKRVRYVPNSVFGKIIVDNPSRMTHRRIKMIIGVRYDDSPSLFSIIKDIDVMVKNNTNLDQKMVPYARFNDFNESSIDIMIYGFTTEVSLVGFLTAKQDLAENIMKILEKYGAEMAFPTRTLHIEGDSKD